MNNMRGKYAVRQGRAMTCHCQYTIKQGDMEVCKQVLFVVGGVSESETCA